VNNFDPGQQDLIRDELLRVVYKLIPYGDKWKRHYNTEEMSYKAARSEELRVVLMKIQAFWVLSIVLDCLVLKMEASRITS
jgi:hypothetical protein